MRMFRRGRAVASAGLTLALASFAVVAGGSAASAATGCSYDGNTDTVTVTLDPGAGVILWVDEFGEISLIDGDNAGCGGFVTDTDVVNVTGDAGGDEILQIDESVGTFAPGATVEAGESEVEMVVNLQGGSDTVFLIGTTGNDDTDLTSSGIDLYDDGDTDIALSNVETLDVRGSDGDDTLGGASTPAGVTEKFFFGDGDNDTIVTGGSADYIDGGDGDDAINAGTGNDVVIGGDGTDDVAGNGGIDTLDVATIGTSATEGLDIDIQNNTVGSDGWGNVDTISGLENVEGTDFADVVKGNSGANTFNGYDGDDNLQGRAGVDTLNGGNDDDVLNGSYGGDSLTGGSGNDRFVPGTENDTIVGGAGANDVLDYSRATNRVIVILGDASATGQGTDTFSGIEDVTGSNYNDTLTGDANDNTLLGRAGNDSLSGLGGNDTLTGGDGKDTLSGGAGSDDTCNGNAGTDTATGCETEAGIP